MSARAKKKLTDSDSDVFIPEEPKPKKAGTGWLFQPGPLLVVVCAAALVVFAPQIAKRMPDISRRPEYLLKAEHLRITDPPPWVPQTILQQVIRDAKLPEEISLLDEGIVEQVAQAFQKNAWVERVESVRKDFRAGITVAVIYRKPVAIVAVGEQEFPIDRQAVLLPPADAPQVRGALPTIRNARSVPAVQVGGRWGDPLVEGAAKIAELVAPCWQQLEFTAIEIPAADDGGLPIALPEAVYTLHTRGGSRILWGAAPGVDRPGELTPAQKVARLDEYQSKHGTFDSQGGPWEIDIRHWQALARQRVSSGESAHHH